MKFNAQLSKFTNVDRHCQKCFDSFGTKVDETFAHGSYECPVLKSLIDKTLWVFGLNDFNNSAAIDLLVRHYYIKKWTHEQNHGCEAFLKIVTMRSIKPQLSIA